MPWPDREDSAFDPLSFETVAHHVRLFGGGGVGLKPSDYWTVPLTDREHRELHQQGERSWWLERDVDPRRVIVALLARYVGAGAMVQEMAIACSEDSLDGMVFDLEARAEADR